MRGATYPAREVERHRVDHHRSRDERGRNRRPARARAHRRHGPVFRRRPAFELPPDPRDQEPFRRGERAGRVRDDGQRLARRVESFRAVPVASRKGRGRLVRARHPRGHQAAARRNPGVGGRGACAESAAIVGGTGTEPAGDAARGAPPPRGHRVLRPGCVRERRRRRAHRRTRGGSGGHAGDRLLAHRPADPGQGHRFR